MGKANSRKKHYRKPKRTKDMKKRNSSASKYIGFLANVKRYWKPILGAGALLFGGIAAYFALGNNYDSGDTTEDRIAHVDTELEYSEYTGTNTAGKKATEIKNVGIIGITEKKDLTADTIEQRAKSAESYLRNLNGEYQVLLEHKNDQRTIYVFLQYHPDTMSKSDKDEIIYEKGSLECQIQLYREIREIHGKGIIDAVTLEGFMMAESDISEKANTEVSEQDRRLMLGLNDDELRIVLPKSHTDLFHILCYLKGIKIYGWENQSPEQQRGYKRLVKIAKDTENMSESELQEAIGLIEKENQRNKKRSWESYNNTLTISDRLAKGINGYASDNGYAGNNNNYVGNMAVVIGAAHIVDYGNIAEEQKQKPSHPRLVLILPKSCEYDK
ncbi:MAG: hypothetical protein ABIG89_02650 [Candidatus Woesearchaeota archaeon]